jgi:hypothetical protein
MHHGETSREQRPAIPGSLPLTEGLLRAVEAVEREVSFLAARDAEAFTDGTALEGLRESWSCLRALLGEGPSRGRVRCRHCGTVGPADETHCWRCWTELVPPPVPEGDGHAEAALT